MFVLFNLNSAFPHHGLNKRQSDKLDKLDKLSYVLTDSVSDLEVDEKPDLINGLTIEDGNTSNEESKVQHLKQPQQPESTATNKYSTLVTKIVKQILSKRTKSNVVNEYRRRKNVEQIEKNDLIKSSIIDKKFKLLSELTLKRLKPAFELQLPDMTPEEHDELVNDINKLINEDGSFRSRDGKR